MIVFRVREYKIKDENRNCPPMKLEVSTEFHADNFAHIETDWIYFYAELISL